jgi:dipeptidyl aminopeptidase/acylaminoacyl peptidase
VITTTLIYGPLEFEVVEPLPVVVASYPSEPINWDRVSVALANEGYLVLASGPSPQRGLDISGMGRDLLKAVAYLRAGQLADDADTDREGWLGGSFSSLILYQALLEQPGGVDALVVVGGISDGFLFVQSLYDVELEIPPKYAAFVASLGRPDRVPEYYLGYSPALHAAQLPPTFVVHTYTDEVIPYNQSLRLDKALTAAGVTHELFLYEDTTHYLDQVNVTPDTAELYRRLAAFLDRYVRQSTP